MNRHDENKHLNLPPLILAYLGDAVYELCVRQYLAQNYDIGINKMNIIARKFVTAQAQAAICERIEESLTEDERDVFRRGRNANKTVPKSASVSQYRRATGLEALFGQLFVDKKTDRINELFSICAEICEE